MTWLFIALGLLALGSIGVARYAKRQQYVSRLDALRELLRKAA